MMPISNGIKKDAQEMLAWLETPAWSGLVRSIAAQERETLETSARLYGIALDAQRIGKMLQQSMHVDGVAFQDVLDDLARLTPALSPEEQDASGRLAAELENAKWLEGERLALQVVVSSERAKNETLTQTNAMLAATNAELVASGRRVGAAAEWVGKGLDKREKLAIVRKRYNELKSILQIALGRSTGYAEWSSVASPVVAELMKHRWPDKADLPLAVSTLEKVLRDEKIHHYPETETDNMRTERRDQFIRHCKFRIDQHREGVVVVRDS